MDFSTLAEFRSYAYACLERAADALMNVSDALLTETPAQSLAELSLSPCFERRWPSIYAALQDGKIDRNALQKRFAQYAPVPQEGEHLVVGGDASSILRVQSPSVRDRTYVHAPNLPEAAKPVRPGWQFSELAVLPKEKSSWVYVLDNRRIPSTSTQAEVMFEQLRQARAFLLRAFLFLGDGYYGSAPLRTKTADIDCDVLVRFAKNRVLYRQPLPVTGKQGRGHPRWHGAAFKLKDQNTHAAPGQQWEGTDPNGHRMAVCCWHNLHFAKARTHNLSLLKVVRHAAADTKRDPKVSWFLFWGKSLPDLADIPALYARRYNLEHAYRTAKQDLLWETPRLRTPEQFSAWTDLVSLVRNELFLARDLVTAQRQPWQSSRRPRTPQQVRRAMGRIIAGLGTPARRCQPRGYSPGWPSGRSRKPVPPYPVVYKASEEAQGSGKRRSKRPTRACAAS
jgi:hypothetical protein